MTLVGLERACGDPRVPRASEFRHAGDYRAGESPDA